MFVLANYFSVQIFFIIFRETLETAIIISVLLSFISQRAGTDENGPESEEIAEANRKARQVDRKLRIQVWSGAVLGLTVCLVIGMIFIISFYVIGKDYWSYTERIWEGVFSLLSSVIITIMGIGLLRINKVMKIKWWVKLGDAYSSQDVMKKLDPVESISDGDQATSSEQTDQMGQMASKTHKHGSFGKRYFLAILPFITTLREGLEAVVFVGGIGMSQPLSSLPASIAGGILFGSCIGLALYKGGNKLSLQYFLIFSTCFLYIVSAGLLSRGVWFLELERYVRLCDGLDVSETGSGPGSYDISNSVWHVNCCNGLTDGWWMVFNAIFGWTNSATYGSVISYFAYWCVVIIWLKFKLYEEKEGVLPLIPIRWQMKKIRKKIYLFESKLKAQNLSIPAQRYINSSDFSSFRNAINETQLRDAESQFLLPNQ